MDPLTMAMIGGGVSSLATSAFNAYENTQNRQWSTDMANTSHQREVADLTKAGLNPMLSVNKGAPMPSAQAFQASNPGADSFSAAQVAAQLRNLNAQAENTEAKTQTENLLRFNTAAKLEADAAQSQNMVYKSDVETSKDSLKALQKNILSSARVNSAAAQSAELDIARGKAEHDWYSSKLGHLSPAVNSALDAFNKVNNMFNVKRR